MSTGTWAVDHGIHGERLMRNVWTLVKKLGADEEGAALIEYTVLLGILIVAVIATIAGVGGWVNGQWATLSGKLT